MTATPAAPPAPATRAPRRALAAGLFGNVTVALYLGSMLVGGAIVPGYSHLANTVSELTSTTGEHRTALAWAFSLYNVALAAFGVALSRRVSRGRARDAGLALWLVVAVAGVLMVTVLPQPAWPEIMVADGSGHMALAGVAAVGLIVSAFCWSRAFAADAAWAGLSRPSFVFGWAILGVGGFGALLGSLIPSLFGLGERFTMVTYLAWFSWIAITAMRRPATPAP